MSRPESMEAVRQLGRDPRLPENVEALDWLEAVERFLSIVAAIEAGAR